MRPRHPALIDNKNALVVVIDMQEPFLRSLANPDRLIDRCRLLIGAAALLDVPVLTTTQYGDRMGGLVPQITEVLPSGSLGAFDKLTFSCAADEIFATALNKLDRNHVVLCGVETHICVLQTALDLAHLDYSVHCVADAVSSRSTANHELGLVKMGNNGVDLVSTEGAVMEMIGKAGSPKFKAALTLIK